MAILNRSLGIRYESVDFNSVGAMNLALIKDEAQLLVNTPSSVKGQIEAGQMRNRAGELVTEQLDGGLLREDGRFVYPIRRDIPVLLIDEALPMGPFSTAAE